MKKLGAFLAITSLLTLVPAAFAAGGDVATPSLKDPRIVSSEASPDASPLPSPGQYGAGNTLGRSGGRGDRGSSDPWDWNTVGSGGSNVGLRHGTNPSLGNAVPPGFNNPGADYSRYERGNF